MQQRPWEYDDPFRRDQRIEREVERGRERERAREEYIYARQPQPTSPPVLSHHLAAGRQLPQQGRQNGGNAILPILRDSQQESGGRDPPPTERYPKEG
jgi:hypothetical protein